MHSSAKLSEVFLDFFILRYIMTAPVTNCICQKKLSKAEIDKDLPLNKNCTEATDRIGHSFSTECCSFSTGLWTIQKSLVHSVPVKAKKDILQ
jgi:hypothetical protein